MCGIAGHIQLHGKPSIAFRCKYDAVLSYTAQRGVDAWGVLRCVNGYLHQTSGKTQPDLSALEQSKPKLQAWLPEDEWPIVQWSMASFRGIPTNEWFDEGEQPVQPFAWRKTYLSHNGQIADSPESCLEKGFDRLTFEGLEPKHYIDSEVLHHTLEFISYNNYYEEILGEVTTTLAKMEGSWAYAFFDERQGFVFGRNYRGLYFALYEDELGSALLWASERAAFGREGSLLSWELPPYSNIQLPLAPTLRSHVSGISPRSWWQRFISEDQPLDTRSEHNANSVVVVLSGGLDSTVCATWACQNFQRVKLLHYCYGARAEYRERYACEMVHEALTQRYPNKDITLDFVPMNHAAFDGNALTDHSMSVAQGNEGVRAAKEWVPARNTVFIAHAAAYCDQHDYGTIILGLNMQEASVYRDNAEEFYREMERALNIGTMARPRLKMPLSNLLKQHVVKFGYELSAPLGRSWSCYEGHNFHCGSCGPCFMRLRGHLVNAQKESLHYETYPSWFPKNLRCDVCEE